METTTTFNYFQIILDDINEIQKTLGEPRNLNLRIIEEKGTLTISNGNVKNRKLNFADKMPELMTQIFKKLISNYGASIISISLMLPKKNLRKKKIFIPILFRTNQAFIGKFGAGEGKLLVKSKREVEIHLKANPDGSFPFSCSMITQIKIDLKSMEYGWSISKALFNPV